MRKRNEGGKKWFEPVGAQKYLAEKRFVDYAANQAREQKEAEARAERWRKAAEEKEAAERAAEAKRRAEQEAEREAKKFWAEPGTEQWDAWYSENVRSAQSKYAHPPQKKLPQVMDDLAKEGKPWLAPSEWPWGHPNSRKAMAA